MIASPRFARFSLALALTLYQAVVALGVAWPVEAVVRASYGHNLDGDAPLWREGSLELLDLVAHARPAWSPLLATIAITFAAGALLGVAPIGMVIRSLGDLEHGSWRPLRTRLARSVPAWGTLLILWIAYAVLAVLLVVAVRVSAHLVSVIADGSGEVRAQQIGLSVGALLLLLFIPLNALHDLAQVTAVLDGRGFFRSVHGAFVAFRRHAGQLSAAWAWRAIAGMAFVAVGGLIAGKVGGLGGASLALLAVAHQIVVLARASLRVDWLGLVVRDTEPVVRSLPDADDADDAEAASDVEPASL